MSLLTPLYLLGLAAVALPLVFHLIRRQPRGRLVFSTVMFLEPSPARVTRRSRLDHWPLLLLRALAVCLLALAFARPFLREILGTNRGAGAGESVVVLIDTSASMRRAALWDEALRRVERMIAESRPADRVAILAFDREVRPVVSFEEWSAIDAAARGRVVRERLQAISPGWAATHLDQALTVAAESLQAASAGGPNAGKMGAGAGAKRIVVVGDLAEGSRIQSLASTEWPQDIAVDVERIEPAARTNAGLQLVAGLDDADEPAPAETAPQSIRQVSGRPDTARVPGSGRSDTRGHGVVRVRVTNAADSRREQFQLGWRPMNPDSLASGSFLNVYCPAGQSRVVRVAVPAELSLPARIVLSGDDHVFDNEVAVDRLQPEPVHVVYSTDEPADDPAGMRFYLEQAFPEAGRTIRVTCQPLEAPGPVPVPRDVPLVVLGAVPADDQSAGLRRYVEQGGTLLIPARTAADCALWNRIGGGAVLEADEAEVAGYAILGGIDFGHPLFAPFDEARFADFTSLRIWQHRRLTFRPGRQTHRVLASFDGGSPAIIEQELGRGRILLFAFGWQPADSQLALSTKFVPLLHALVGLAAGTDEGPARLLVGDALPLAGRRSDAGQAFTVHTPDRRNVQVAAGDTTFPVTVLPGVYRVAAAGGRGERRFLVTLPAEESRTAPLPLDQLEALGVRLATSESPEAAAAGEARERQLRIEELESRQKHWRWLIVAGLGVLMLETGLAGRLARRRTGDTDQIRI